MTDDAMFHVGAAYLLHEYYSVTQPDQKHHLAVLEHTSQALKVLRKRITRSRIVDNATLLAMLYLPFCEVCCLTNACARLTIAG